ncbi:MAG: isoprenylcysteine carboxylmethyltransferase family protein [Candidatus Cloacimonetes bacterium]|nr:isoprenylcysteine carboxylmethyltransferase family protein [Candidatus Cloacimonadota bacterium]
MKLKSSVFIACCVWSVYIVLSIFNFYCSWHSVWSLNLNNIILSVAGILIVIIGVVFYVAGIVALGSLRRASGILNDQLITKGIYRFSRNPQLLGWGLILSGVALIGESGLALIISVFYWIICHCQILLEEKELKKVFGDEYKLYMDRTHRYFGLTKSAG